MLVHSRRAERLAQVAERLNAVDAASADLVSAIIAETPDCLAATGPRRDVMWLTALIEAGAWTDAALALMEIELPRWELRRLAYDDGEWYCALSSQRELPEWLDQAIETHHPRLQMALLKGLVAAMRQDAASDDLLAPPPAGRLAPREAGLVCCDNFA